MATKDFIEEKVEPRFDKGYSSMKNTFNIPVTIYKELSMSPRDCRACKLFCFGILEFEPLERSYMIYMFLVVNIG